jgi:hypothetical protein
MMAPSWHIWRVVRLPNTTTAITLNTTIRSHGTRDRQAAYRSDKSASQMREPYDPFHGIFESAAAPRVVGSPP